MTGDRFIKDDVLREEKLSVQVTYQPTKTVFSISDKDSFKMMCSAFAMNCLRLMYKALTAKYTEHGQIRFFLCHLLVRCDVASKHFCRDSVA